MQRNIKLATTFQYIQVLLELLCVFFVIRDMTGVPASTIQILVVNVLMVLLFFALNYMGREKMFLIVGAILIIGTAICLWLGGGIGFFVRLFEYGMSWAQLTGSGNLVYESLLLIIVSFLGYIVCTSFKKRVVTWMLLPIAAFVTIFVMTLQKYQVSVASGVVTICLLWQCICGIHALKGKRTPNTVLFYLPFSLVFFILIFRIPVSQQPYQWPISHAILNRAESLVFSISSKMGYWDSDPNDLFAGYGDNSRFGGDLHDNNTIQMEVRGAQTHGNFYMRGRYYNVCESDGWISTIPANAEDSESLLDWLNALWRNQVTSEELEVLTCNLQYEIFYGQLKTNTIFGTLGMFPLEEYQWENGKMTNDEPMLEGYHYGMRFFEMNYQSETFLSMMNNSDQTYATYEELSLYAKENLGISLYDVTDSEKYSNYCNTRENLIQTNYLQLPEHMTERVQLLANELTKNCDTDYEKMQAIVDYVRTYTYSTAVGELYEQSDCIADTFLFEAKQGYCVHFASSAAILGRCCDIPTRYVSGYLVDFSDRSDDNKYEIRGYNAHAWLEAYIEGYGWVRFEPTAAYPVDDTRVWERLQVPVEDVIVDASRLEEEQARRAEEALAAQQLLMELQAREEKAAREASERVVIIRSFLTPVILLIIMLLLLCLPFQILLHRREYKKACGVQALDKRLYVFERILEKGRSGRGDNETLQEYVQRVWEGNSLAAQFLELYQKYRYGQLPVEEKMMSELDTRLKKMEVSLSDGDRWQRLKMWIWIWK